MSRLSIALFLLFAVSLRGVAFSAPAAEGNTTPLAYIGNDSRTTASGRVRCGCEAFSIRR